METYFHNDPRIHEWIEQITEKIFTVCLLKGVDAETEFNKGCRIVVKLTILLQSIAIFPPEYLKEGVEQLIEQQLPAKKIINNFPSFADIKSRMLAEGVSQAINIARNEEISEPVVPKIPIEEAYNNFDKIISLNQDFESEEELSIHKDVDFEECSENIGPALSLVNETIKDYQEPPLEAIEFAQVPMNLQHKDDDEKGLDCQSHSDEAKERLEYVLKTIYPGKSIQWNMKVANQPVFAKIEDLLICLDDPSNFCNTKLLNRQGWKALICSYEDLLYPRRVERGIRQILRQKGRALVK
ncbi:hypothetical protein DEAC_c01730 [Desulfosporosinus acididurans]|uniref:Uncharacterized protein n=1 Tax=Desulfosporosinus acididurans TaxID=476652 RepID=A0A0J1FXM0_9FIRM|nr:hypothetical protein [Desulfosporosinus acididurans]KLU67768.1 hypothetical protein DEAC_c01730 [Desulfosporosinus acididurans]